LTTTHYAPAPKFLHILAGILLWLVLGIALWRLFTGTGAKRPDTILLLYLILVAVAGALWLTAAVTGLILRSHLAAPVLTVVNARPCLGELVRFRLALSARRSVTVSRVVAVLSLSEEVRRARRREKILPLVVFRADSLLAENLRLEKGESRDLPGELLVPPLAMQSFESHLCACRWQLDLLVFVGRQLAWRGRETMSVQPVRIDAAEKKPA
jgi:hypothetical protein